MLGNKVVFDIHESAFLVDPLECVAAVAVIVTPSVRSTMVAEKHHTCMVAFWGTRKKIKERIIVEEEVPRGTTLRTDDIWALDGISTEEDGPIESFGRISYHTEAKRG